MGNGMKRSMLRSKYDKFCQAWKNEKKFQKILLDDGAEVVSGGTNKKTGQEVMEIRHGGKSVAMLGRKPTFSMWLAAYKSQQGVNEETLAAAEKDAAEKAVEVTNPEW